MKAAAPETNMDWQSFLQEIQQGSVKHLSRGISILENETPGYMKLRSLINYTDHTKIIGITGPPGSGKSTLTDALIGEVVKQHKRTAVLCVDPSSPFHRGALLGDRIRMTAWYNHPDVFIRSLGSRGSLGGLHPKIIEITELLNMAAFDYIFIETVGVGQSEVEIAGLADLTVVVTIPEGGDYIQTLKAGLMEIADIFVVNKADRPDSDLFVKNLQQTQAISREMQQQETAIIKTIASEKKGVSELFEKILEKLQSGQQNISRRAWLLAERAYYLILQKRMLGISKQQMQEEIVQQLQQPSAFNLHHYIEKY